MLMLMWWVVPIALLLGRGALEAHRTRKRRLALRTLEEKMTPFTRDL